MAHFHAKVANANDECPVCLCAFPVCSQSCDTCVYVFHQKCWEDSLKLDRKCPVCRSEQRRGDDWVWNILFEAVGALEQRSFSDMNIAKLTDLQLYIRAVREVKGKFILYQEVKMKDYEVLWDTRAAAIKAADIMLERDMCGCRRYVV